MKDYSKVELQKKTAEFIKISKFLHFNQIQQLFQQSMRLHFNSDATSVATSRKLQSVIHATEAKVEEVAYKTGDDVSKVSSFNTLPLLETPEGTFFSSNTIIRYLASAFKKDLYGGDNNYTKSLVDQWLDITTCDFEPAVRGIPRHVNGEKIDFGKLMEDVNKFLTFVDKHLSERKFLVGDSLSIADLSLASSVSVVFGVMFGQGQRKKYSHTLTWYLSVAAAHNQVGPVDLAKEPHEAFRGGKKGGEKAEKADKGGKGKKQQTKAETKKEQDDLFGDAPKAETKKAEEDDLFGDDTEQAKPAPVVQPKKDDKKKKEKPAAKSIVVFDVKVFDEATSLENLFELIKALVVDGLTWNQEAEYVKIAYGMRALRVGCVVEDAKVSTEDLFETIEALQVNGEKIVQSTDTVSFQKL